jgi:glutaredoxin
MSDSKTDVLTDAKLVLYYSTFCYFCQKVLMFMRQKGIELETRNTSDREHAAALRDGGGKLQVPCLFITERGKTRWMYESDDIIAYLGSCKT